MESGIIFSGKVQCGALQLKVGFQPPLTKRNFKYTRLLHGAGTFTNIWAIFRVNIGTYSIHGAYGIYKYHTSWSL